MFSDELRRVQDPYVYPGTNILRNKFNIQDDAELQRVEYTLTLKRQIELQQKPIKGNYDMTHLRAIHRHIFQDVYEWAGEIRTIPISKNGHLFGMPPFLESYYTQEIAPALSKEKFLRGIPEKTPFVERLAFYFGESNSLYPFREGNGRATQTFFRSLAKEAGYHLDYAKIDRQGWNHAAKESHVGNLLPIRDVFLKITDKSKT